MKAKWSGEDLKQWREKQGLSQSACAKLLGYSNRSAICRYERGHAGVPVRLQMLCETLDRVEV
jgi:transcriptional regulator with XRE-family HTH domain